MSGEEIVHVPLGDDFRARFGNPYAVVHRADLHMALLDAAQKTGLVDIRTNHRIERYEQDGGSVTVFCHGHAPVTGSRSEEHTSELQSLMRISYAVFCLKKK